ncbi:MULTISPECIES: spore maturation protein [Brevibacillus]|jgi:spore maturation protein B|uniref:Spore maturation protein B n=1 Tax=Brevibacillus parabrevis TaxID=54914 RepID=A0A4Y3PGS3_BREPA|nr:spore maturation protein [Brevibacillus parabrevis]MBU8712100.1 spore maturation protein [Brevibacillus parabrevis]MDR5001183.1 spore maturation protein [Brevibacillus parabrevis]RNB96345.1 spore maturation protein [Brevibacillus parabrevis]WDV97631.1 spore maturation protein [Brevibacillus parabrevis]GEB32664.1 spore maturation protein B [Brevibacillus parabrevis]
MYQWVSLISLWAIPVTIAFVLLYGWRRQVPVYETFVEGAKGGLSTTIRILPHLIAMMVAVSMFRESGALDMLLRGIKPVLDFLHFPEELVPLALLRPLTGTGSLAIATDLIAQYGPDSFFGRLAATMQGSTDTTLYVLTVYFGAVGIRNSGYALKVGLWSDLAGVIFSLLIVSYVFS